MRKPDCEERDATGANVKKRYFAEGEQRAGGADAGNYYYTRDHLGSIREVTNSSGALVAQFDYDPWGNESVMAGSMNFDFGYTGQYLHGPSGLNLAQYRAYNPTLGRWMSPDPLEDAEMSQGPNLYAYVGNDAIDRVDPSGLYGFTTKFWADLSVNGNWLQRAIAWPLGIIGTIATPDTVGLTGSGTLGYLLGWTAGVDRQWSTGNWCHLDFNFAGDTLDASPNHKGPPDFSTPQISASFQGTIGYSSDYNPNLSTWGGWFQEATASVGPFTGSTFKGGSWNGLSFGGTVGPVPISISNINVNYDPR